MGPQKDRESEMHEMKYGDRETQTRRQKRYTARDRKTETKMWARGRRSEKHGERHRE